MWDKWDKDKGVFRSSWDKWDKDKGVFRLGGTGWDSGQVSIQLNKSTCPKVGLQGREKVSHVLRKLSTHASTHTGKAGTNHTMQRFIVDMFEICMFHSTRISLHMLI